MSRSSASRAVGPETRITAIAAGGGPEDSAKIVSVRGPDELGFILNIQTRAQLPICHWPIRPSTSRGGSNDSLLSRLPIAPAKARNDQLADRASIVWRSCHFCITTPAMKMLTVRLPDALVAEIEAEARRRMVSKSDVVRERLTRPIGERSTAALDQIADLVGSIEGLPSDLSESRRSEHGRKRDR
jgi:Arc/MetJ-type ribon-helix-helix transcriptional regulator